MKFIRAAFAFGIVLGCSSRNGESMVVLHDNIHNSDIITRSVRIVAADVNSESTAMKRAAPEPVLLPPEALKVVYEGVFGSQPRSNPAVFFSVAESDDLGGYRVLTANSSQQGNTVADPSMVWLRQLSSDYIFTLRRFAADACGKLVAAELVNPASGMNKLVSGNSPSSEKINGFLSELLGFREKNRMHEGVEKYLAAFEQMKTADPAPKSDAEVNARLRSSYNHLCVALATDVRVYYR